MAQAKRPRMQTVTRFTGVVWVPGDVVGPAICSCGVTARV
jgi:hypothetical protein